MGKRTAMQYTQKSRMKAGKGWEVIKLKPLPISLFSLPTLSYLTLHTPPCIVLYCPAQPLSATPNTNISLWRVRLKATVAEEPNLTSIIGHQFYLVGRMQTLKDYVSFVLRHSSLVLWSYLMRSDVRVFSKDEFEDRGSRRLARGWRKVSWSDTR